ncbi:MAG TPA: LamG-like jellyroll fold domain-containing protein, partial [Candidatus Methanoperedens sp.]|nr:LamG-like jellyroll fold domain-containing protein [Candidatus Methanoperedens sp.]
MNRRSAVGGTLALATGFVLLAFVAWSANADRLLERLPRAVERAEHGVGARLRAAGIVAYWDFDGTRPRDRISGEGVLTGGTRIVAGREGSARRFVPKEEAFIRTTLPLTALGERFTFSCWLKFPEEVPNQQVFQYLIVKDGKLVLRLPGQKTCEWPLEIRGRFFHAAFTVDQGAGRAALFVDGEKKGELDLAPVRHNAMPLCFGQDRWMPPAAFSLDEASLWDRALSEQEIRKLSRLRWSLAADRAAARLALLRGASALRNGHAALLLAADLFNPFLHESRVLAAGLPSYALALSRNDERHFTQYFNEIVGNGLNAQGTSEKRTVELLDDGQKRTAVMELVSASQIGPESSAKQSFTLEVLAADGTTERKVLLRPIEGTSYLLEMLAAQLGRESGIRGVFSELSVVTINGTLQGIYLAEDLLQDKGPFWRGEADQWQSLLRRVPVFRGEVLAQFDRLAEQLAGALESDRKSPLTSREIRRELLRQRELLG